MTPQPTATDARTVISTEARLHHAVQELEPLLPHIEKTRNLLVEVLAMVRSLADAHGVREAQKRIVRLSPGLPDMASKARDLARQINVTADDLQEVLTGF